MLYDQGCCTCIDISSSLLQFWGLPRAIAWRLLNSAWSLEWMGRASVHGRSIGSSQRHCLVHPPSPARLVRGES